MLHHVREYVQRTSLGKLAVPRPFDRRFSSIFYRRMIDEQSARLLAEARGRVWEPLGSL